MTRDEAEEMIPIIQAYIEGKTIQTKVKTDSTGLNERWVDCINPDFDYPSCYRVKPDPKYRPFRNAEECWQEMQKHQLFGWIKYKSNTALSIFMHIENLEDGCISMKSVDCTFNELFDHYIFVDGTPLGIRVG